MKPNSSPKQSRHSIEESPYYVPAAFAVMLIGLLVLFGSFLFSGKLLYGSDTLTAGIFHRSFLVEHFTETGAIPQWNPYAYGGMPYVDAFHGDIFYPLSVLKFFLPLYFFLGFNLVLHIFLAGVFMYLAARQFKLGKTASLFSAAAYMFAPYLTSMVAPGHDGKIYATALFPLVVLLLDRAFETRPFLNFSIVGLILGMIILTPQPETAYFTFWVVGLYTLFKIIIVWWSGKSFRPIVKYFLLTGYAVLIALGLSTIQFYPGYVYTTEFSARAERDKNLGWATSWSMHEEEAFSQLIPEFCGTTFPTLPPFDTKPAQTSYWGKNSFKDNSDSAGVVAIFLSLSWFFFARRKETYFFAALASFAFIYALGASTPLFDLIYNVIPKVDLMRAPGKILFIFSFSIALLAGFGIQSIIDRREANNLSGRKPFNILLVGFPALLFVLAVLFTVAGKEMLTLWTFIFPDNGVNQVIKEELTKFDLAFQNLPDIQKGAWFAFLFTALAVISIWIYLSGKMGLTLIAGLVVLPIIDGTRFNSRFVHVVDPKTYFEPNELIEFFKAQKGEFRVMTLSRETSKSYLPQFGVEVVQGYHGNQLRWYDDLLGGPHFSYRLKPRFLNLVGARYVMIPGLARLRENYFGKLPAKSVAVVGKDKVIQNDNAFERVYLANKYTVFHYRSQIPEAIINGNDDLSQFVYLEKLPPLAIPPDSIGSDSTWIKTRALDSIVVGVHCTSNRLLVLIENYYDSWHLFVDGQPAELLRAYGSFRAVAIAAGTQEVKFTYYSNSYQIGKAITTVTSAYLLIIFGFYFWKSYSGRRDRRTI